MNTEQLHLNTLRSCLGECAVLLTRSGQFPLNSPCETTDTLKEQNVPTLVMADGPPGCG